MNLSQARQAGIFLDVRPEGNFERMDFDRKVMRRAMRRIGREVRVSARRLVARRAISNPDEYPGVEGGELQRSIAFKVSKSGFAVVVQPKKTAGMAEFYPAFLNYGTKNRRRGGELKPRKNYMVDALSSRRASIQAELFEAMKLGLKD